MMYHWFLQRFPEAADATNQIRYDFRPPLWVEIVRDMFPLVITATVATVIRVSEEWRKSETSRKEAEKALAEAELQNLRSQLNPHFLLNTLNNIYALIAFDTDKAQESVQELSKLLRHVLYENKDQFTTMSKEMEFIQSYIELMRIRLSNNVTVETKYDLDPNSQTPIAPLIFISLVENAFKHGISPTEPSFIKIRFSEIQGIVRCLIQNSNHRKVGYDKSGSGIGLEQVQKRLDLSYPGKYTWHYGLSNDGKEYSSSLEIHTT
jgi:LytS/YehU family sensor histidine kinase